jgi:hypothetical protein
MRLRGKLLRSWAIVGSLGLALALVVYRIVLSPVGLVIRQDPDAPWIMFPMPVTGMLEQWGNEQAPVTRFASRFTIADPPARATLRVRAFGEFSVFLNGKPIPIVLARGHNWKKPIVVEVSDFLQRGDNEVGVAVSNVHGPALLSLRLDGEGLRVATGPEWFGQIDHGSPAHAIIASDVRPFPSTEHGERTFDALRSKAIVLLTLWLLSSGAFLVFRRRFNINSFHNLPRICLGLVALGWLILFVTKFVSMDLRIGFDAIAHLKYVEIIHAEHRLPLATEGWSTYHPPLFYLLNEIVARLAAWFGLLKHGVALVKLLPLLAGLGCVWVTMALCRRLFAQDVATSSYAVLFAGFLPMNIYMAAYFSNEGLLSFLFGCGLLLTVDILLDARVSVRKTVLLSVVLGLALLTKFTAALMVLLAVIFVSLKTYAVHRSKTDEVLSRLAALIVPLVLVSAWFYIRNLVVFGRPVVANWGGLPNSPSQTWWSYPGFHTLDYYLSFGVSLVRPYLSGMFSFWDGLYSSLWGDGFLAGRVTLQSRHPYWNYEYMAAVYPLAVPATLLTIAGWFLAGRRSLREADPWGRAAFSLLVILCGALLFFMFYLTLQLPFYGQAKASYLLAAVPVLAVFFALASREVDRWMAKKGWLVMRALFFGWLGTFFAACYLSFAA